MKKILTILAMTIFVANISFASFPVKNSPVNEEKTSVVTNKSDVEQTTKVDEKVEKKTAKLKKKLAKKAGDDNMIAIILGLVSVLLLPFAFHNWYLGENKKALWQTLMVFPGFILLGIPALISWIWQIIDLVKLF